MSGRLSVLAMVMIGALTSSLALPAQDDAREVAELRRRITAIRKQLPVITEAAEYAAGYFKDDSAKRIMTPKTLDPGFWLEFYYRAGGPPEFQDADDPPRRGVVILPVRHWEGIGLGVAMLAERYRDQGRPMITIGPAADRPSVPVGRRFLDNGAPNGDRASGAINSIANMIIGWTWYAELVAAATRDGWWTGSYLSVLVPGGVQHNAEVRFRMPGLPPAVIAAGMLGGAYLDALDTVLASTQTPSHRSLVAAAADSLRARRRDGGTLFVATCGHYLMEEIPRDTIDTPFRPVDWRWDMAGKLRASGASPGDAMLWFGYAGYDCPSVEVSAPFLDAGLRVVVVTDRPARELPRNVVARVPLEWRMPDAGALLPFPPGAVAPTSSIDMTVHYLWLRRLLTKEPGGEP